MTRARRIPVMRPLLPTADEVLPYLRRIDDARWYSNFGELTLGLEERLADLLATDRTAIVSVANGTAALSACLRSMNPKPGSFCLVPSWTFVATAAAPTAVGLEPYFLDVDPDTWALDADQVKEQLRYVPGDVGAVIVVAPFGAPVDYEPWDRFTADTGIPVVIDAAAGFDSVATVPGTKLGRTPVMVSLHATKPLGVGEGAFVISRDKLLLATVRQMTNFGFMDNRDIELTGVNAKMSEYSAAVGHAALDAWPTRRAEWLTAASYYHDAFARVSTDRLRLRLPTDWVSSVCNVEVPQGFADKVISHLNSAGAEARRWWPRGCHQLLAYQGYKRFAVPVTERLVDTVVALPFFVDITRDDVDYVVGELASLF